MDLTKTFVVVLLVVLCNGFVSVNMLENNKSFYTSEINTLLREKVALVNELKEFYRYGVEVDVTMYQPIWPQTDKTPNITADGTRIRISNASDYKYVALSRNLLKRWGGPFNYGDFILIKGTKDKDGVYNVRDTMNPKYINYVDILESTHVKPYKYENVQMFKMNWSDDIKLVSNK